jgi:hypothetical protein
LEKLLRTINDLRNAKQQFLRSSTGRQQSRKRDFSPMFVKVCPTDCEGSEFADVPHALLAGKEFDDNSHVWVSRGETGGSGVEEPAHLKMPKRPTPQMGGSRGSGMGFLSEMADLMAKVNLSAKMQSHYRVQVGN